MGTRVPRGAGLLGLHGGSEGSGAGQRSCSLLTPNSCHQNLALRGQMKRAEGSAGPGGGIALPGSRSPFGVHLQEAALLKHCWNAKHRVQSPRFKHLGYGELRKAPLGPALLMAIPRAAVSLPWGPRSGLPEPLPAGGAR